MWTRAVLIALALVASGCGTFIARAPVQPPRGFLYTSYRAPLSVDFDETRLGSKHGTATVNYFQDVLFTGIALAWGEGDLEDAARNGGIKEVRYADYELLSVLGVFVRFQVHAYGD